MQYPKGYLAKAFDKVRAHGGLCISDEVQTGFGRTGDHFWGFEGHGVIPDMVTMAKGIGNGFPLAAVVTTREIGATMVIRSATTTKNSVKSHNSMNLCVFTEFFVLGTSSTFQHLWRKSSCLYCRNGCPRYH